MTGLHVVCFHSCSLLFNEQEIEKISLSHYDGDIRGFLLGMFKWSSGFGLLPNYNNSTHSCTLCSELMSKPTYWTKMVNTTVNVSKLASLFWAASCWCYSMQQQTLSAVFLYYYEAKKCNWLANISSMMFYSWWVIYGQVQLRFSNLNLLESKTDYE